MPSIDAQGNVHGDHDGQFQNKHQAAAGFDLELGAMFDDAFGKPTSFLNTVGCDHDESWYPDQPEGSEAIYGTISVWYDPEIGKYRPQAVQSFNEDYHLPTDLTDDDRKTIDAHIENTYGADVEAYDCIEFNTDPVDDGDVDTLIDYVRQHTKVEQFSADLTSGKFKADVAALLADKITARQETQAEQERLLAAPFTPENQALRTQISNLHARAKKAKETGHPKAEQMRGAVDALAEFGVLMASPDNPDFDLRADGSHDGGCVGDSGDWYLNEITTHGTNAGTTTIGKTTITAEQRAKIRAVIEARLDGVQADVDCDRSRNIDVGQELEGYATGYRMALDWLNKIETS